nr:reverse transcriptase domain-containing protein [Tanacetum cinerariifolium]
MTVGKGRRDEGLFNRLGGKEKSMSAHSEIRYQSSRSKRMEPIPRNRYHEGTYSRRMKPLSESEDSGGGHWKSRSKKKKSSIKEDDLHIKGAPECMRISGFMHEITNPELIKRLHDNIPKSIDEMMRASSESKEPNGSSYRTPHWVQRRDHMANETNIAASKNRGCIAFKLPMDEFCGGKITISVQWDHRKAMDEENPSSLVNNSQNVKIPSSKRNTHSSEQHDNPTRMHNGHDRGFVTPSGASLEHPRRMPSSQTKEKKPSTKKEQGNTRRGSKTCGCQNNKGSPLPQLVVKSCNGYVIKIQGKHRRNKVCPDKVEAVLSLSSLKCLKDVQKLNGKLASLNNFLSKSAKKSLPFFKALKKCTKKSDFQWTVENEKLKKLIAKLPTLTAPMEKEELIVYLAAAREAVSAMLMTERGTKQTPLYFVSRTLQGLPPRAKKTVKKTDSHHVPVAILQMGIDIAGPFLEGPGKHPQANRLVERANKSLREGIKVQLDERSKDWTEEIPHVLWAHRTMIKSSNRDTPFSLTYIMKAVIPAKIDMPTLRTTEIGMLQNDEALEMNLYLLEERREQATIREARSKEKMEKYYNSKVRNTSFKPRDLVYQNNDASHAKNSGKLSPKWEGPYKVTKALGKGAYKLRDRNGKLLPQTWNVHKLKKCYVHEM